MFLNLSNHPSTIGPKTITTSLIYGELIDMLFLLLTPQGHKKEVHQLAK
jgi:hypothetical protein